MIFQVDLFNLQFVEISWPGELISLFNWFMNLSLWYLCRRMNRVTAFPHLMAVPGIKESPLEDGSFPNADGGIFPQFVAMLEKQILASTIEMPRIL